MLPKSPKLKVKRSKLNWPDKAEKDLIKKHSSSRTSSAKPRPLGLATNYIVASAYRNGEGIGMESREEYMIMKAAWEQLKSLDKLIVLERVYTNFVGYETLKISAIIKEFLHDTIKSNQFYQEFLEVKA